MNPIVNVIMAFSKKARERRAAIFRSAFVIDADTRILDLGSGTGSHIHAVLRGTPVKPDNVYIADIDSAPIEQGKAEFGFVPVLISESKGVPFPDGYFDIVYCSSVIEHVTVLKERVWSMYSDHEFKRESLIHQKRFAQEIQRVGKQYFVQTPYKHFPIESHICLPFLAYLPRWMLIPLLRFTNLFWVMKSNPDWHLLNRNEMADLFENAKIIDEKAFGLTKSIMAVKTLTRTP